MIRDMSHLYARMKLHHLYELERSKRARLFTLRNGHMTYLDKQEIAREEYHLKQIKAEIQCRKDQSPLF